MVLLQSYTETYFRENAWFILIIVFALFAALIFKIIANHQEQKAKEEQENKLYKDMPKELREMTDSQLQEYQRRIALMREIKSAEGKKEITMIQAAQTIEEVNMEAKVLKDMFPHLKEDIDLMAEVRKGRIKEKL